MSGSHPNIYRLVDFTKTEQSFVEATILQPAVGGTLQIGKEKYRQLEDALHRFKAQFQNGDRPVINYVDAVSPASKLFDIAIVYDHCSVKC